MSYNGIPSAKVTLDYPIYACDFDHKDATRVVVGGGGGAGRSGVGNKIVFHFHSPLHALFINNINRQFSPVNCQRLSRKPPR